MSSYTVQVEGLTFELRGDNLVDIYRGDASVPFDCTYAAPDGREPVARLEAAAQAWMEARPCSMCKTPQAVCETKIGPPTNCCVGCWHGR